VVGERQNVYRLFFGSSSMLRFGWCEPCSLLA